MSSRSRWSRSTTSGPVGASGQAIEPTVFNLSWRLGLEAYIDNHEEAILHMGVVIGSHRVELKPPNGDSGFRDPRICPVLCSRLKRPPND